MFKKQIKSTVARLREANQQVVLGAAGGKIAIDPRGQ
jgi:hypothetical protein